MKNLDYVKIVAEMKVSELNNLNEEDLRRFLRALENNGLYCECSEQLIDGMTEMQLREECKKIIKICQNDVSD